MRALPIDALRPPAKPLSVSIGPSRCQSPRRAFYWLQGGRSEARGKEKGSGAGAEGRERPVWVWPLPLFARGLQAGLRFRPQFLGTVCEAPPGQRERAAGGSRRIMSAKDERAREILRGFKLYPPGSGAGPGGLGRRPLAEETGRGRGPLQVDTRGKGGGKGGKERRPGAPRRDPAREAGKGASGGKEGTLMGAPWVEAEEPPNGAGRGSGRRKPESGRRAWVREGRPRRGCGP